jgi:hypothetical protein
MAALSDTHKAQVQRFLSFLKGKRERLLSDRDSEKQDFMSDRLPSNDAIFNKPDVEDLMDTYHAQMIGCIREALEEFINLSAVYVSQVFMSAEQCALTLNAGDVFAIENQNTVAEISALVATGAAPQPALQRPSLSSALPTLAPAAANDPVLVQKIQDLEQENVQLQHRLQMFEGQINDMLTERQVLHQQLAQVGQVMAQPEPFSSNSTQFKELKAIVNKKTHEIKLLRDVLRSNGLPLPGTGGGIELAPEDD